MSIPQAPRPTPDNAAADAARLCRRVQQRTYEAIRDFRLVEPGDHLLVAVSGGKDSLALLHLLGQLRRRYNHNFQLTAIHVKMSGVDYLSDSNYLSRFAEECGAGFEQIEATLTPDRRTRRPHCFLCARLRRKLLFDAAQRLGCGKIALGHHQDDLLLTAMMNLVYNGTFATMPARLAFRKMPLTLVRPLCKNAEDDLRRYAEIHGFHPLLRRCPHEAQTTRTRIRQPFEALQLLNPEFRQNLWHALLKAGALTEED